MTTQHTHPNWTFETPPGLAHTEFAAMGTTVSLLLPDGHRDEGTAEARALFAEWEATLSRFRPESELSRLNARAGETVEVSALLLKVLTTALAAASATRGLYDPTLLHPMIAFGYDRSFDDLSADAPGTLPPYLTLTTGGWRAITVDQQHQRVTLPPGAGLDFGGIAKGMAVDATVARLRECGIASALVNAGGDLAVLGLPPAGDAWPIAIAGIPTHRTLPLQHGALATSGIARRRWRQGGIQRHHLLDPRTGQPSASGLWSASVVADRCEQAEVAAKVAFILGREQGGAFLQTHGLPGLLIALDGSWCAVGAWPADWRSEDIHTIGASI